MTQKRTRQPDGALGLWGAEASQLELEAYVRSRLTAAEITADRPTEPAWFQAEFAASWATVTGDDLGSSGAS